MKEVSWNPWHGCHKYSAGCENCYVYALDKKYDRDSTIVTKSKTDFDTPIRKKRDGTYKIPPNSNVKTCLTSDFFIEEADPWRQYAWSMIKNRPDCQFMIPTKRATRIKECLPKDWKDGYDNVTISLTCENQKAADKRIPIILSIPMKHIYIFVSPILEYVNLKPYMNSKIERVCVGGESYENARICDFKWVEQIYIDCLKNKMNFSYHQSGSNLIVNGKKYRIEHKKEYSEAQKGEQLLKNKYKKTSINQIVDVLKN